MYNINSIVQLKKPHACGNNSFVIIRTGADYKFKCAKCGHIILLDKISAEKAVKKIINSGESIDG